VTEQYQRERELSAALALAVDLYLTLFLRS
jgi:hypothetical protein